MKLINLAIDLALLAIILIAGNFVLTHAYFELAR